MKTTRHRIDEYIESPLLQHAPAVFKHTASERFFRFRPPFRQKIRRRNHLKARIAPKIRSVYPESAPTKPAKPHSNDFRHLFESPCFFSFRTASPYSFLFSFFFSFFSFSLSPLLPFRMRRGGKDSVLFLPSFFSCESGGEESPCRLSPYRSSGDFFSPALPPDDPPPGKAAHFPHTENCGRGKERSITLKIHSEIRTEKSGRRGNALRENILRQDPEDQVSPFRRRGKIRHPSPASFPPRRRRRSFSAARRNRRS